MTENAQYIQRCEIHLQKINYYTFQTIKYTSHLHKQPEHWKKSHEVTTQEVLRNNIVFYFGYLLINFSNEYIVFWVKLCFVHVVLFAVRKECYVLKTHYFFSFLFLSFSLIVLFYIVWHFNWSKGVHLRPWKQLNSRKHIKNKNKTHDMCLCVRLTIV